MEQISLWDELDSEATAKKLIKKIKKPKVIKEKTTDQLLKSKKVSIEDKLKAVEEEVNKILGQHKEDIVVIKDYDSLVKYFDTAIENGIISIDTETNNSLNTFDCKLMGPCLYTPGQKWAYVPVNHTDLEGNRLAWQITEEQLKGQFQRVLDNQLFEVYHNATFDIEVIKQTCGVKLKADWDTMVAAQLLDENELKGLKAQYKLHIDPEHGKYDIEHLFKGLSYAIVDPDLFALYAATDAGMTYELYEYQRAEFKKPGMEDVYKLFQDIEIPILDVIVDMELEGVEIDTDYAERLSKVYHEKSDAVQVKIDEELERLKPQINAWRESKEANTPEKIRPKKPGSGLYVSDGDRGEKFPFKDELGSYRFASKTPNQQLADPPELSSPTQMAILLYDILKAPILSKDGKRSTGADLLSELADKIPLCKLLDEKRGYDILINTFIDKMPEIAQKDGRVHASFNSCGTQTGRFSSNDPNLQNIPSHAKDIRGIFKAPKGYSLIGGDFSAQEPRSTATLSQDHNMINAYKEGKDLYAVIASKCFKNDYEDNLEFRPGTGELQPEGKARRAKAKTILLGITYGMGPTTLAERMGLTKQEAEKIIDEFYAGFPGVKKLTDESQAMLKRTGYVTDMFGRRRHIPDAQLPEYEITRKKESYEFNPLIGALPHKDEKFDAIVNDYLTRLKMARWKKDKDAIIAQAGKEGLIIKSNNGFINKALRQCLNARIQGTAASMTKLAMIMIHNDKELNDLGFKLLVTVHDEVFGMAPTEVADRAAKRLCEVMVEAAKVKCSAVPWKVDPYIVKHWYSDELSAEVLKDYNKCNDLEQIKKKYCAINPEYVKMMCEGTFDCNKYEDM